MKHKIKQAGNLLDAVLEAQFGVSRQKAKQIVSHARFLLNGTPIKNHPKQEVKPGDILEINSDQKKKLTENTNPDKRNPVAIHFEDDYLLVAIKPAGLLTTHEAEQKGGKSFHKLIENYLSVREDEFTKLYVVHRLDREVEGIVLFAKSEEIRDELKDNWQDVTKKYIALTEGKPEPESGFIESWLMDTSSQKVLAFKHEVEGSKFAKSFYQYIKPVRKFSLVEVTLHTGRKNQIRVHLASINCPIVGDRKYGADPGVLRQVRLAGTHLDFHHPKNGKFIEINYQPNKKFFNPSEREDEKYKII